MSAQGTATIDFGAFPGSDTATIAIAGQAGILGTCLVEAWLFPSNTADHTEDEHLVDSPIVMVKQSSIVPGTGFTISGCAPANSLCYGTYTVAWVWN